MKKYNLKMLLIIIILTIGLIVPTLVFADSGWDSDYGGGGSSSWDSGSSSSWSSHDYSSSRDRDRRSRSTYHSSSGYSSSSNEDYSGVMDLIFIILISVIVILYGLAELIVVIRKLQRARVCGDGNDPIENSIISRESLADVEVKKYFPNMTENALAQILYNKFIAVQIAWMNFDYKSLKELCSDELYSSYKSDLEVLKRQNGQNIMSNFNLLATRVRGIRQENNNIIIKVFLNVSFHDYVINTNTKKVTKGDKFRTMNNMYMLEFTTQLGGKSTICPSCGAKLIENAKECEYCHTSISNNYSDFVLISKKRM